MANAPRRDFFSFCTSLDLPKRRVLGQLSKVIHFPPNVLIFKQGQPSDSLYIINRGVVEVFVESPDGGRQQSLGYVSRGDCLGEVGLLTGSPRSATARTCESCSLQYISEENFYKLIDQVPSFFHYLSMLLAERLRKTAHIALLNSNCLDLSGNLANFDLVTLFQTINHSAKTGDLKIFDSNSEEVGRFAFDKGNLTHARYGRLRGIQAIWQLFSEMNLTGSFAFFISETAPDEMDRVTESMNMTNILMVALQMRDEISELGSVMEQRDVPLTALADKVDSPDERFGGAQAAILEALKRGPRTLNQLREELNFCDFFLCSAVLLLGQGGLVK